MILHRLEEKTSSPFLKRFYEKGEVDFDAFPWEELEDLYERPQGFRAYRYNLVGFYSAEEIEARQKDDDRLIRQWIEETFLRTLTIFQRTVLVLVVLGRSLKGVTSRGLSGNWLLNGRKKN